MDPSLAALAQDDTAGSFAAQDDNSRVAKHAGEGARAAQATRRAESRSFAALRTTTSNQDDKFAGQQPSRLG
jgi:hypothetical protein